MVCDLAVSFLVYGASFFFFILVSFILSSSEELLTKNLCLTHLLTDFTVVLWLSLLFFLPCFMILEFCIVLFPCPL